MSHPVYDRFSSHDGTSIAYRVSGHGPPVVLVHGYTVTSTGNFATHFAPDADRMVVATEGPTVESALLDAGLSAVMLDLRGHGHSDKPHERERYSMETFADDVRALVDHLGLDRASLVGYSLGSMIVGRLLGDPWVTSAVLCGTDASHVDGVAPDYDAHLAIAGKCFIEGCWDDQPELAYLRRFARLDRHADFVALGQVALAARGIPAALLKSVSIPVMILNGAVDDKGNNQWDLSSFIPGSRRVVGGQGDHGMAPSDPLFQAELVRFLRPGR